MLRKILPIVAILGSLFVAGCFGDPKNPNLDMSFVGKEPFAVIKGPDQLREWYFYYQLDDDYEQFVEKAKARFPSKDKWLTVTDKDFTKFRQQTGNLWFQVTVSRGSWKSQDNYYGFNHETGGTGILVIQGKPGF